MTDPTPAKSVQLDYQRPLAASGKISVSDNGAELTLTIPPTMVLGSLLFHATAAVLLSMLLIASGRALLRDLFLFGEPTWDLRLLVPPVAGFLNWLSLARLIRLTRTWQMPVVATISPTGVSVTNPQDWSPPTRRLNRSEIRDIDVSHFRTLSDQIEYRIGFQPPPHHPDLPVVPVDFTFVTSREVGETIVRRIHEILMGTHATTNDSSG